MEIRTHVGRHMDMSRPSNRAIVGLSGLALIAAVIVWWNGASYAVLWGPVHTFLAWAVVRELDPDHEIPALIAALVAGAWVVSGLAVIGALAVGALLVTARLVTNSTGRRPLLTDLIPIGIFATAIAFTRAGWVAGFGLALAIYIDDRMAPEQKGAAAIIAAGSALGASGVATLSRVFPRDLPDVQPLLVVAVGVLALIAVVREPVEPASLVDSRLKNRISQSRLHASRSLFAVLLFATALLVGPDALAVGPLGAALALALVSNEVERIRRAR
jgi:hypothetical protein